MEKSELIRDILINCENNNLAPAYSVNSNSYKKPGKIIKPEPVNYCTEGEDLFVVSDLHIASGMNDAGVYQGTENFFADDSFYRFTTYADKIKKSGKAILVINGDIFDFLRITDYPGKIRKIKMMKKFKTFLRSGNIISNSRPSKKIIKDEFYEWSSELKKIGISKSEDELKKSISHKEKIYGLQTDNYKTVYKLIKIKHGHPVFLKALKEWIEKGNKLILVKGNHDLELYWSEVRNYIRLIIAEEITGPGKNFEDVLKNFVLPNITFIDDSIEINKSIYIEHGHRYDKYSLVLGNAALKKNYSQLNIPFGSFFNRYLLNRIELFYPFIDNVRPTKNILPILIKENFPLALKIFFRHIPLLIRILGTNIRYVKFMLNRLFWFALGILSPLILLIFINPNFIHDLINKINDINNIKGILSIILTLSKDLGLLILPYFLARLVAWLQLEEPSSLNNFAEIIFENTNYKIIIMGHTHNPGEYLYDGDRRFFNTGTWIPVIETSTAEIREDKSYTFLHFINNGKGELQLSDNGLLLRWNDDACRADQQILIQRK